MHLQFLLLSPDERRLYFEQAAQRRNLSPVIVEKDFWVCWLLALLFNSRNGDVLVFKGGTSLSKVFGVIARFSEDIDLSVSPEFLELPDIERLPHVSRNRANQWMKEAEAKCAMAVHQEIQPELERSFWEKATILHAEYHRPPDRPTPDRFSRHYADTAALALHPIASQAIESVDLRDRVVQWKSRFFGSGWARYDLARPGTFRLVPPPARLSALRLDYDAMRDMYLTTPVGFDLIVNILAVLEARINGVG